MELRRVLRLRPWIVSWLFLVLVLGSRAQETGPSEYQLKAAFLYNFAKFVEWPTNAFVKATSPMVVGVLGENPFGNDLEQTIHGKTVNQHPFEVKEFHSLTEVKHCHILFISTSETDRLHDIFETLRGSSVLTVGETKNFTESGGMINFVRVGNKVRFEINNPAAEKAGLIISSKLLSLAQNSKH